MNNRWLFPRRLQGRTRVCLAALMAAALRLVWIVSCSPPVGNDSDVGGVVRRAGWPAAVISVAKGAGCASVLVQFGALNLNRLGRAALALGALAAMRTFTGQGGTLQPSQSQVL